MSQSPEETHTIHLAITALQDWEQELDAVQRARLAAARQRALATPNGSARAPLAWGGALATALLLLLGISLWPAMPTFNNADPALLQATLEDSALETPEPHTAELLLDEDLDFYLWLDGNTTSAGTT